MADEVEEVAAALELQSAQSASTRFGVLPSILTKAAMLLRAQRDAIENAGVLKKSAADRVRDLRMLGVDAVIPFWGSVTDLATDVAPFIKTESDLEAFVEQLRKKVFALSQPKSTGVLLYFPDGASTEQGSVADRATWWTCGYCSFTGPYVGTDASGRKACMGSCGGVTENPSVPRLR